MNTKITAAVLTIATLAAIPASSSADQAKCFKTAGVKAWTDGSHNAYMEYDMLSIKTNIHTHLDVYHGETLEYFTDMTDTENYGLVHYTASQNLPISWGGDRIKFVVTARANGCTRKLTRTVIAP